MTSFKEELIKLKEEGCNIWLADSASEKSERYVQGKVLEVGADCAIIETFGEGRKLYNINQIVWVQKD